MALTDLGQRAAALKDYERAIRSSPRCLDLCGAGRCAGASGDAARAIESYDKALALRPDWMIRAPSGRACCCASTAGGGAARVSTVCSRAIRRKRRCGGRAAKRSSSCALRRCGCRSEQAHALSPRDGDVRRALARAYLGAGAGEAAWRILSPDLDATDDAADLTLAAMVAMLTDRLSAADQLVRRAIDLKPGEATAQAILSLDLRRQGDAEDARDAAELAVAFAPDDAEIAHCIALAPTQRDRAPLLPGEHPAQLRARPAWRSGSGDWRPLALRRRGSLFLWRPIPR